MPFVSSAQTIGGNDAVFGGSDIRQSTKVALGNPDEKDPRDIAASIINVVFGFLGLLAVSLTLYAGYIWMTSQGQPDKIEKAKDILKNAAIGILIILSAYAIVLFIFRMFFGGNLLSGGGGGNKSRGAGIGALGNGIIVSLYPAPNQTDVPRNTGIIVTFREPIDPRTICATTTVPVAGVAGCNGELIATTTVTAGPPTTFVPNIRIYFTQNAKNCEVADAAFADPVKQALCGKMFSARVYSTQDNKTFVFKPTEYLGSPSEYIWHTVYMTKNIKKMNGEEAFKSFNSVRDTSWSFEVSNKLDLEPPRVDPAALYPAPDNFSDEVLTESIFVQASSTVIVSNPVSVENLAKVVSIATSSGAFDNKATSTINEECDESEIKVGVAKYDGELVYTASSTKKLGKGELSSDNKSLVFAICNLKLTPSPEYGLFTEGNFWKITINKYVEPARLTIGNHVYTASSSNNLKYRTFAVGLTSDLTADSLKNLINADEDASASSTRSTNILTLVSRTFGVTGNDIQLASNDNLSLAVMANKLTGGKDAQRLYTIKSRRDKPRNSLIQINFSEAMNPIPLTGSSSFVKDFIKIVNGTTTFAAYAASTTCQNDNQCQSLACSNPDGIGPRECIGDYLPGIFRVSNQYKTVEFTSDHQCGVNGCGQKIYCLPGDANIRVQMVAASLEGCLSAGDCSNRQPFTKCSNRLPDLFVSTSTSAITSCQDQVSSTTFPINYPASKLGGASVPFDGQMDVCFNSMDGNSDKSAQGPFDKATSTNYFNENSILGICSGGKAENRACTEDNVKNICGLVDGCQNASSTSEAKKYGDNYKFNFWINNEILSGAPAISSLGNIDIKGRNIDLIKPAILNFNRVMSIGSLTSGRMLVPNGATTTEHRFMNLGAFSKAPVGYWGSAEGVDNEPDGEMDKTRGLLNHTDFDSFVDYWAEVGSGVIDINQNCYKPSQGPHSGLDVGLCAADQSSPSCCNGNPTAAVSCDGLLN